MKLLIHALGAKMGGAMRHLTNFLPELGKQDTSNEYRILVRHGFPELFLPDNIRLERVPDEAASHWGRRLTLDIIQLPRKLSRERFDAIVSLTNFGPIWSPVPHIFFQRNSLYYCSHYLATVSGKEKYETLMRRWLAMASMKRAALVVTPSNAMAEMIKETCPQVRKRPFRTLYHGYSKDSLTEPLESRYGEKLAVTGYKLLYPTHPATHKGFEILFEIVELLKAEGLDFTLFTTISREDWPQGVDEYSRMIRERGLGQHVVFMGRVPQSQMGALYERCDLMVYPSLCESFGFSMIEAMGHGLPIVASDTSVNREICGNGAIYYPPLDGKAGAEAIKRALDPGVTKELRGNGRQRMDSFDWSWERYAREFVEIMADAIK